MRVWVTTTMTDVATRLHSTSPHAKRPNARYAKCLPSFVIVCGFFMTTRIINVTKIRLINTT
jgi:hypothetical protein